MSFFGRSFGRRCLMLTFAVVRCFALCATIRMIFLTIYLAFQLPAEVVVVDQVLTPKQWCGYMVPLSKLNYSFYNHHLKVSTPLPFLRLLGLPTIFYCHYPDLLLSTDRTSLLKRLYRAPLDWLEQWTTGLADILLVNSNFTKEVFRNTFPRLNRVEPAVLYPSLSTKIFQVPLRSI